MNVTQITKYMKAQSVLIKALGDDTSLRQVQALLLVAQAGAAGIDGVSLERKLGASQAAVSRIMKALGPGLGLIEFYLDQTDGRRRLARLCPDGETLLHKVGLALH